MLSTPFDLHDLRGSDFAGSTQQPLYHEEDREQPSTPIMNSYEALTNYCNENRSVWTTDSRMSLSFNAMEIGAMTNNHKTSTSAH